MASVTRSNRRAEGLHHPHHAHHHHLNAGHNHHHPLTRGATPPVELFATNDGGGRGRQKRTLEPADRDIDALKPKKARIAVEILARQPPPPMQGVRNMNIQPPPIPRPPTIVPAPAPAIPLSNTTNTTTDKTIPRTTIPPPPRPSTIRPPPIVTPAAESHHHASSQLPSRAGGQKPADEEQNLTRHQAAKAINGIKSEQDRLQPKPATTRAQGRKLRSQEATRFKSDLSAYFPDYDEVIGNDPKEQHLLNPETPIVVFDSNARRPAPDIQRGGARAQPQIDSVWDFPVRGYGDSLYTDVFDSQRIDFRFLETQQNSKKLDDPLPDSLFEPSHKRSERLERSIRNTEKGRAQHEKDQIIRLLEGLQGHDWLRVMGVSGVTETKKKSFEPARKHFIKGCQGILEKFRTWNLEEKRRKLEKEKAILAEQQAAFEQEQQHEQGARPKSEIEDSADEGGTEGTDLDHVASELNRDEVYVIEDSEEVVTSQSDTSDASPAKQLRQEALARSQLAAANSKKPKASNRSTGPKHVDPPKEFTSFFRKKYERDSSLNRTRRTGRKVLAWGHPVPDMDEADFVLPEEYRDEDLLKSRARKKRRDKRHSRP